MKKLISLELLKTSLEAIMDKLKLKADKAYVEESIDNLSVELNSTLNNKTNNSDFENHINNTEKHTSLEEKTSWNNKSGEKVAGKSFTLDSNNKTVIAGTGAERFNNYSKNIATGMYSHAEGSYTEASGNYSHAEGSSAKATGTYSHAEGTSTYAVGQGSHAEGSAS